MYNDYYLNEINQNLVVTNTYLDYIYQNQNTIISNQEFFANNICSIGFVWVILLMFAIIFYQFYSHIFRRK